MTFDEETSPLGTALSVVLTELIGQSEVTTAQIHRQTGIARTSLYAWLRGKGDPSLSKLWTLAAALDLRPSELLKKVEKQFDLHSATKR
jgi:transcriptional regulator with XRE-family HTH domain